MDPAARAVRACGPCGCAEVVFDALSRNDDGQVKASLR
jgi:hypothetical protein